jgi:hypothetical protein
MKKTLIPIAILVVLLALGGWFYLKARQTSPIQVFDSQKAIEQEQANDRKVPIETYVTRNISGLSAEAGFPAVLGGTFQVTKIEAHGGAGTVSYEDGHNAYTADFTYKTDAKGLVSVTAFTVKK